MKLTDAQIDLFVESILPCAEWTIFAKGQNGLTPQIMRSLAFLSPGIVLPAILDVYATDFSRNIFNRNVSFAFNRFGF